MQRFLAILERDLRKFVRNPIVVAMSLLMPIIYLLILGSSFQGELKNLSVGVVDLDNGPHSERVFKLLEGIEAGPKTIEVHRLTDQGFAMEALRHGFYKAVVVIPEGFGREIIKGRRAEIGLFLDNAETISANTIYGAIASGIPELSTEYVSMREETYRDVGGVILRDVQIYRRIDYEQTLIPGVVIMAIFLGAMTTGVFNVIMDRFLGVEESYFLTPLTRRDIVMGLVVSGLMITTVLALIVLLLSSLISGIPVWRIMTLTSLVLTIGVIVLSTLGLQGLMFTIMGRLDHPRVVGILSGFLNVIFFFPSGAIYPVESFPWWLKLFAQINPETYSVHALRALLFKGAGFEAIKGDVLFLGVFAVIMIALGTATFKRGL